MGEIGADERILSTVRRWPGVKVGSGPRGETGIRVGRREIGHLHGDRVAHFAFPRDVRDRLLEDGRVVPHPVRSPGLAARRIASEEDVQEVLALLRLNYDRVVERHGLAGSTSSSGESGVGDR